MFVTRAIQVFGLFTFVHGKWLSSCNFRLAAVIAAGTVHHTRRSARFASGSSTAFSACELEDLRVVDVCAQQLAAFGTRFLEYRHLRDAPTLFLLDHGVVFRKRGRVSHRATGAGDSRPVTDHAAFARSSCFATD